MAGRKKERFETESLEEEEIKKQVLIYLDRLLRGGQGFDGGPVVQDDGRQTRRSILALFVPAEAAVTPQTADPAVAVESSKWMSHVQSPHADKVT